MSANRREFLRSSAATIIGLTAGRHALADDKNGQGGDFNGFTVGVQSYTFRNFKLEPALKKTQELGLKHAEFFQAHVPLNSTDDQIKAVKKLCGDYGITPNSYGVQSFVKNHETNKKVFDFAQKLGVKYLSADPTKDSFDSLDKLVDETKIAIAIHPHGPVGGGKLHQWYSAEVILKAVKDHHPLIGTCLDTGHLIRAAQLGVMLDPATEVRTMGARNFGLHLKDHDNARRTDVVYGKGVLNVPEVLKALRDVKFTGYISIEYEANPEDPSADVKECVAILKDAARKV